MSDRRGLRIVDDAFAAQREAEDLFHSSEQESLKAGGGGGTSGGVTDEWKASVDRQLGQLHGDVRALLRWGMAAVVALAAMIGGLYVRTDAKFAAAADRSSQSDVRQQRLEDKIDLLIERTAPQSGATRHH